MLTKPETGPRSMWQRAATEYDGAIPYRRGGRRDQGNDRRTAVWAPKIQRQDSVELTRSRAPDRTHVAAPTSKDNESGGRGTSFSHTRSPTHRKYKGELGLLS